MARAQGARAQMALAFETVYGTPPGAGYILGFPDRGTRAELGRLRETPILDALPPGRGRDRDRALWAQDGFQPDKTGLWEGDSVRHDALRSEDVRSDLAEEEIRLGRQNA